MTISNAQREELDRLGMENVRLKLAYAGYGRGAAVAGFLSGDMDRSDVEDWLAEQTRENVKLQNNTLWWAKASALVGAVGIIVAVIVALLAR